MHVKTMALVLGLVLSHSAWALSSDNKADVTNIFVQISKKMIPSVVNISSTSTVKMPWSSRGGGGEGGENNDLWRKFFEEFFGEPYGGPSGPSQQLPKAQSLGTGFIIEASNTGGLILTNNHVVEGAEEIQIKFTESDDEKDSEAELVGNDPELDVALLKVKTRQKLEAASLGDSDKLDVGEWIAAVGNPFGHGHSVSHGIVSAKERTLPGSFGKYLQVDAPINPGNSGGPLVNLKGEVVGINNAIDARGPGIGFAIPINLVKAVLPQLKTKGRVQRGYIGVSVDNLQSDLAKTLKLDESLKAPIITNVMPGGPADKAKPKLQVYDAILAVNGKTVRSAADLVGEITSIPIGKPAEIKFMRSGKEMQTTVAIDARPDFRNEKVRSKGGRSKKESKAQPRINVGMTLEEVDTDAARELGLPEHYQGVVVSEVDPRGPAFKAGLTRGDVILEIDRKPIKTVDGFYNVVRTKKRYLMRVRKQDEGGQELFVVVTLNLAAADE